MSLAVSSALEFHFYLPSSCFIRIQTIPSNSTKNLKISIVVPSSRNLQSGKETGQDTKWWQQPKIKKVSGQEPKKRLCRVQLEESVDEGGIWDGPSWFDLKKKHLETDKLYRLAVGWVVILDREQNMERSGCREVSVLGALRNHFDLP